MMVQEDNEDWAEVPWRERYNDGDLILITDIKEFPATPVPLKGMLAFLLVREGNMQIEVNDEVLTAGKNDLLICAPTLTVNSLMVSPSFRGEVAVISLRLVQELVVGSMNMMDSAFYLSEHPVLHLNGATMEQFYHYFAAVAVRIKEPLERFNKEVLHSILRALMYELMGYLCQFVVERPRSIRQGDRLFRRFLELLTDDKVKERSVSAYADKLCVTPKYLSAVCKSVVGRTASALIDEYVVKEIRQQLKYSDKSIKEIALDLDFPNLSFFGKYVKAHLGVSPTEYRREVRTSGSVLK